MLPFTADLLPVPKLCLGIIVEVDAIVVERWVETDRVLGDAREGEKEEVAPAGREARRLCGGWCGAKGRRIWPWCEVQGAIPCGRWDTELLCHVADKAGRTEAT